MRKYPKSMHVLRSPRGAISACRVLEIPAKDVGCATGEREWGMPERTSYGVFRRDIEANIWGFTNDVVGIYLKPE